MLRQWRLQRARKKLKKAEIALADEEHHYALWHGHFGYSPSDKLQMEEDLKMARVRVAHWQGKIAGMERY